MNEEQKRVVEADARTPLLVVAGAGSGKTLTMVRRVENIIKVTGCSPREILAITFTKNACEEMKERIQAKAGKRASGVVVLTIHSLCLRILRSYLPKDDGNRNGFPEHLADNTKSSVGYTKDFTVANRREQMLIVEEALDTFDHSQNAGSASSSFTEQDPKMRQMRIRKALQRLQRARACAKAADDFPPQSELAYVLRHYETAMRESNTMDFHYFVEVATSLLVSGSDHDDLIDSTFGGHEEEEVDPSLAWAEAETEAAGNEFASSSLSTPVPRDSSVASAVRAKHRFILVDEFQDVSGAQFAFLKALVGPSSGAITVVGDDDQSIYGFQGAAVGNFETFREHFKARNVTTLRLEQNYRSSGNIVTASNAVIQKNSLRTSKKLWTERQHGNKVLVCECRNSACEVSFVVQRLQKLRAGHQLVTGGAVQHAGADADGSSVSWGDMAVLFRTNATGQIFKEALRAAQIPFTMQGEHAYSALEIDDVLAFLRLVVNESDDRSFLRVAKVLRCPLPDDVLAVLKQHASAQRVSLLHSARWFLRHNGKVSPPPVATAAAAKAAAGRGGGRAAGNGLKRDKIANVKQRRNPCSEVKKIVDCVDSLKNRLEELPLPAFVRRVVDCHPWVKQRMQRHLSHGNNNKNSGSGTGRGPAQSKSSLSSLSVASGTSSAASSTVSASDAYGDLGAALIREAEQFDDAQAFTESLCGDESAQVGVGGPKRVAGQGKGQGGAPRFDNEDDGLEDFSQDSFDAEVLRRYKLVKDFLDHLAIEQEEDTIQNRLSKQGSLTASSSCAGACSGVDCGPSGSAGGGGGKGAPWRSFGGEQRRDEPAKRDAVFLGTVHQAKGLEWPTVFVARFNEEEFPLAARAEDQALTSTGGGFAAGGGGCCSSGSRMGASGAKSSSSCSSSWFEKTHEEEERRLAYVALSRPQHTLCISYILLDEQKGGSPAVPSRFLDDIPKDLVERSECFTDIVAAAEDVEGGDQARAGRTASGAAQPQGSSSAHPWALARPPLSAAASATPASAAGSTSSAWACNNNSSSSSSGSGSGSSFRGGFSQSSAQPQPPWAPSAEGTSHKPSSLGLGERARLSGKGEGRVGGGQNGTARMMGGGDSRQPSDVGRCGGGSGGGVQSRGAWASLTSKPTKCFHERAAGAPTTRTVSLPRGVASGTSAITTTTTTTATTTSNSSSGASAVYPPPRSVAFASAGASTYSSGGGSGGGQSRGLPSSQHFPGASSQPPLGQQPPQTTSGRDGSQPPQCVPLSHVAKGPTRSPPPPPCPPSKSSLESLHARSEGSCSAVGPQQQHPPPFQERGQQRVSSSPLSSQRRQPSKQQHGRRQFLLEVQQQPPPKLLGSSSTSTAQWHPSAPVGASSSASSSALRNSTNTRRPTPGARKAPRLDGNAAPSLPSAQPERRRAAPWTSSSAPAEVGSLLFSDD